jgi:hypothetical protein
MQCIQAVVLTSIHSTWIQQICQELRRNEQNRMEIDQSTNAYSTHILSIVHCGDLFDTCELTPWTADAYGEEPPSDSIAVNESSRTDAFQLSESDLLG